MGRRRARCDRPFSIVRMKQVQYPWNSGPRTRNWQFSFCPANAEPSTPARSGNPEPATQNSEPRRAAGGQFRTLNALASGRPVPPEFPMRRFRAWGWNWSSGCASVLVRVRPCESVFFRWGGGNPPPPPVDSWFWPGCYEWDSDTLAGFNRPVSMIQRHTAPRGIHPNSPR